MARVTVTVDDDHLDVIADVAQALQDSGMTVDQVLEGTGHIMGSVPEDREQVLQGLEGVASVDRETHFQLPPPDAEIQ